MTAETQAFRAGFVALLGRPNVGKSTLLNRMLGEKVAIVSDKPQTTRNRIMGVKHLPHAQLVFLDTPGIHKPRYRMNQRMVETALRTLEEVDVVYFVVEATSRPMAGDRFALERVRAAKRPIILVVNKIDQLKRVALIPVMDAYNTLGEFTEIVPVSAMTGENVDRLIDLTVRLLPENPPLFPEDVLTDQPVRFLAGEMIREKILRRTRDEIPYIVAVQIESFKEDPEKNLTHIQAVIYVERDTQKGIVIGKGGEMLKAIGTEARQEIEALLGTKIFLEMWVKVKRAWREDDAILAELGYV